MTPVLQLKASENQVKSVTIFKSSKAEVTRSFTLQLSQGQTKVEIQGLSSSIDTHSVRVSGLGDARLHDVVCTVEQESEKQPFDYIASLNDAERMRALEVKRTAVMKRKILRENEGQLLIHYAQSLKGEHISPSEMLEFMGNFTTQSNKILDTVAKLDEELVAINRQIADEEKKSKMKKGNTRGRVDIVIAADTGAQVDLILTYIVGNTQWKPTYELHAMTENGKPSAMVKLHYRARINQSTGEDWKNTALTLSTVSGSATRAIPSLKPVKLRPRAVNAFGTRPDPGPKPFAPANNAAVGGPFGSSTLNAQFSSFGSSNALVQPSGFATFAGGGGGLFGARPTNPSGGAFATPQSSAQQVGAVATGSQPPPVPCLFGQAVQPSATAATQVLPEQPTSEDTDFEDIDALFSFESLSPLKEGKTLVRETPVAVTFSVHGQSTIPSDGIDHQVAVAILPFEAAISYITVPKIDPRVYLQCRVKNSSDYRLLAGSVRVIFDDSFVSSTSITDINTGENFECTLGDDPSTKVSYARSFKNVRDNGGAFAETTNTTTYKTTITVHNKHSFDIDDLIVRYVIPTCEDKRGQVVLRKPAGLATSKNNEIVALQDGLKAVWLKKGEEVGGDSERDGIFEWRWKVAGGATAVLEAEWDAKVPGEATWAEVASA